MPGAVGEFADSFYTLSAGATVRDVSIEEPDVV